MKGFGVPDNELPEWIGPYRPLQRLGSGGMGEVFLALDEHGRTVAVKALHPATAAAPETRTRLRREVETMQRVRSGRVAEVVDFDLGGAPYIVTRYVQGRPLAEVVAARGPLHGEELLRVARGLAEALGAIHAAHCVHRDLKPANVMLVDGEPVIIDFGIAQTIDAARVTQQGAMGSPGYMAPEVLQGGRVEPAADVFAWAGTVVFAATGRHAYAGPTPQAVHRRTLAGEPDLDGVVPPLRPLVEAALSPDPARRPRALDLLDRLSLPRRQGRPHGGETAGGTPWRDQPTRPTGPTAAVGAAGSAHVQPVEPPRQGLSGAAAGSVEHGIARESLRTPAVVALVTILGMSLWASGAVWFWWAMGWAVSAGLIFYGDRGKQARFASAVSAVVFGAFFTGLATYAIAGFVWVIR